jgi:glycine dehydrogenase subunit 1
MRYLPLTEVDRREMIATIGAGSVDELFRDVPASARLPSPLKELPPHQGELEVERTLGAMAAKNVPAGSVPFFCGAGAYRHHVPATVDYLIQRGEFLTSYTPYQPEVTQGTLQYLFEFQTQVALLTGMEVANASMYDGSTGCAEAIMMANRVTRRSRAVISGGLHPQYRDVCRTHADFTGFTLDEAAPCHAKGALLVVVVTEVVSLGLMTPPGEMGADIVVCEGQSIGNSLNFGGPYVGLFATREKFIRQMPGRLCGQTVDAEGKRGYVLTLSTREQHIRREKATSNICTNSGLCALAFTIHLSLLGEAGFTKLARINHAKAVTLAAKLAKVPGVAVLNDSFFNEITVRLLKPAEPVIDALAARKILGGVPVSRIYANRPALADLLLVAVTETNTEADIDALCAGLSEVL